MVELFEESKVLLWGLNKVDSIILAIYEKDFIKKINKKNTDGAENMEIIETNNNSIVGHNDKKIKTKDEHFENVCCLQYP
jgi:hypothetical protein